MRCDETRYDDHRQLFLPVGVRWMDRRCDDGEVRFNEWGWGCRMAVVCYGAGWALLSLDV